MFFYTNFSDSFRSSDWRKGAAKKFLNFQRNFFPENDVLEWTYYFFYINEFTSLT